MSSTYTDSNSQSIAPKIVRTKFSAAQYEAWCRRQKFANEDTARMAKRLTNWMRQLEKKDIPILRRLLHEDLAKLIWR